MPHLDRDGTRLYYEEGGSGSPALLLIHGWTCDRTFLEPQFEHFRPRHRVVRVDLRGHGQSDKPEQEYTMRAFADDVAWVCGRLGLEKPVLIGHSMGGLISLTVAAERPEIPGAIVSLDSPILPTPNEVALLGPLTEKLRDADDSAVMRQFVSEMMFLPTDNEARKQKLVDTMASAPAHVRISAFHHLLSFDHAPLLERCRVPWLSVYAGDPLTELPRARELCPTLTVGQTVGSGHFLQLEVPEQVNPMIERFLRVNRLG